MLSLQNLAQLGFSALREKKGQKEKQIVFFQTLAFQELENLM